MSGKMIGCPAVMVLAGYSGIGISKSLNPFPGVRIVCRKRFFSRKVSSSFFPLSEVDYRAVGDVITASRPLGKPDVVRVLGSSIAGRQAGLGRVISLDELFSSQDSVIAPLSDSATAAESVVYYLHDPPPFEVGDNFQLTNLESRHRVQLQLESQIRIPISEGFPPDFQIPEIKHVRESSDVPYLQLGDWSSDLTTDVNQGISQGDGGGLVRVIAGECAGLRAPPPLDDFLFLDISMRPGSSLQVPIPAKFSAIVYILEGVGFFGGSPSKSKAEAVYQNEGHALMIPPGLNPHSENSKLLVRSHDWSTLRLIVIGG